MRATGLPLRSGHCWTWQPPTWTSTSSHARSRNPSSAGMTTRRMLLVRADEFGTKRPCESSAPCNRSGAMAYETPAALRAALEDRLANRSRETGVDLDMPLGGGPHSSDCSFASKPRAPGRWIVKGGMALEVRLGDRARSTRDLDLRPAGGRHRWLGRPRSGDRLLLGRSRWRRLRVSRRVANDDLCGRGGPTWMAVVCRDPSGRPPIRERTPRHRRAGRRSIENPTRQPAGHGRDFAGLSPHTSKSSIRSSTLPRRSMR